MEISRSSRSKAIASAHDGLDVGERRIDLLELAAEPADVRVEQFVAISLVPRVPSLAASPNRRSQEDDTDGLNR